MENKREGFSRTQEALEKAVADGVAPGFVAGIYSRRHSAVNRTLAIGNRRLTPSSQPMTPDTIFDLASVSKVIGTSTLTAYLIERRWITWDTKLKAILPAYPYGDITLRHLLSHTAGLPAWDPLWEKMRKRFGDDLYKISIEERQAEMRKMVMGIQAEARPGERALYSDICFLLMGFALEEVTGMPLDQAVSTLVWPALGLESAFYRRVTQSVKAGRMDKVAATEDCPWRKGVLQGQVHDDNCWTMGGYAGHAGVFATASDLLRFASKLMDGFFSPSTTAAMWTRMSEPLGCGRTPGWDTPSGEGSSVGRYFSPKTVGHLGFTGTSLWIDLEEELAVVLLSNRVHPTRANEKIKTFRPVFHDAIRQDILEYIGSIVD
jgi:CubicO group peptidase (beta-lactamase class C family)